jgi:transcriptional regulator of acetoin/glycerol metabolism
MNHIQTDNTPAILQARTEFLANGNVQQGIIAEAIERSWRRCLANGIDANSFSNLEVVTVQELAFKREKNQHLLTLAQPEMETLNAQIAPMHNVVILTDDEGVILHSLGSEYLQKGAERMASSAGVSWHEGHRGTNAIGTVLVEQAEMTVHGAEHFMAQHHTLSCSAVPIFGPKNQLIATLDVTNDYSISQKNTLTLVKMAAQMIENRLFSASYDSDVVLHFHARPEFIGTLWEGVAMFTDSGQLVAMNRSGQFQLSFNPDYVQREGESGVQRSAFNQLFSLSLASLLKQVEGVEKLIVPIQLHNGARLYVQVQLRHKKSVVRTAAAIVKRTSAANLDLLNSGDKQVAQAIKQIKQVLSRDIPILIQGETGVGKELFSRAIHDSSLHRHGPWIAVNCAALPEGLIEAELFGYEEGAFTGARRKGGRGKIEQAHGGTLFLDEIGDMPLSLQARLLRVLQDRSVTPLGSSKSIAVNFALISATNQKLREKVSSGEFRSDLYYRLNGLSVMLPPLRERTDLQALIQVILQVEHAAKVNINDEVMTLFTRHLWPGNIRQLHNVLRTALALADGAVISTEHLTQDFIDELAGAAGDLISGINYLALDDLATNAIHLAMQRQAGNISAVARELGISRNTLYRKLKTMGLG